MKSINKAYFFILGTVIEKFIEKTELLVACLQLIELLFGVTVFLLLFFVVLFLAMFFILPGL